MCPIKEDIQFGPDRNPYFKVCKSFGSNIQYL